MRATSEVLEDNKVKIAVEIDEAEVEAAVATTAKELAKQVRIPGFRPGKAPRQVVEARLGGPKALRDEAMRDLLTDYYARAVSATDVEPISAPELNVTGGQEEGPIVFDAIVEVRPLVHLTGYAGLRATIPSPIVTDVELDEALEVLRDADAELAEVTRPILTGDHVTMDVRGRKDDGEEVVNIDDFVYPVGQGAFVDTVDEQLVGMRPGETLDATGTAPGGMQMSYTLTLKDVRERVLPELTDEWVSENTDHETAQALRDAYLDQIRHQKLDLARRAMRDAALSELVAQIGDDQVPESLLDFETRERLLEFQRNLERNGATLEEFFRVTHQSPEELLDVMRGEALVAIKVDLALRAVVVEENLTPTQAQLDEELQKVAEQVGVAPDKLLADLDKNGRLGEWRAQKAKSLAQDWVLERVTYVDETGSTIDRAMLDEDGEIDTDDDAERVDLSANDEETEESP